MNRRNLFELLVAAPLAAAIAPLMAKKKVIATPEEIAFGYAPGYTHVVYASGFVITKEAHAKDIRAMAESFRKTREAITANILNRM